VKSLLLASSDKGIRDPSSELPDGGLGLPGELAIPAVTPARPCPLVSSARVGVRGVVSPPYDDITELAALPERWLGLATWVRRLLSRACDGSKQGKAKHAVKARYQVCAVQHGRASPAVAPQRHKTQVG
jgi:hypothetical protein